VSWLVSTDTRLQIEWLERNGPVARPPDRQGFGYLVLTELVAQALQGTAKLDFRSDGVMWRLDIPAASALDSDNPDRSPP
jgi:two-component sensor histidine kinase